MTTSKKRYRPRLLPAPAQDHIHTLCWVCPFLTKGARGGRPPLSSLSILSRAHSSLPQDLVAWVTVGFLHIPHSEDIPNTATPGNSVGFLLRPFNFFPEDPSMASKDTVIVWPGYNGPNYVQRWIPERGGDCFAHAPFRYNGTFMPV